MNEKNIILSIPEPGRAELVEKPFPRFKSGYALIRTEIAPVCLEGSRIWAEHNFEFHDDADHLGHEGVGTVADVKDGSKFKLGDRVIVFQGDHCGQCYACRNGMSVTYCDYNNPDIQGVDGAAMKGIEKRNESESGGFAMAQYRIAPEANLFKIPDNLDFRYAAAANCSLGAAFSNQEVMDVKAGDSVLVGGIGFIAMGHIISALYRNATVIALIRNPYRKKILEQMGVKYLINPDDANWLEKVKSLTYQQQGVDHAVDGSGLVYYQEKLINALRPYGQMNFSGHTPGAVVTLNPLEDIIDPARSFFGQHDVRIRDRERLVRSLSHPIVQRGIDAMVTHEFNMSDAGEAFKVQISKQCGKIYLYPHENCPK
jgi:threonine dehydrogenase-like Zn-dependent dehydrogenase